MTSICENERCSYHRPLPVKDAGAPYIDTMEDGERVRVERYLYRSRDGKRDFFLCDVCHAAVQMVVTPNVELTGAGGFIARVRVERRVGRRITRTDF